MNIEIIHSTDRFADLYERWNELLASSSSNCVFLTHEWLMTWWKHLREGRRLSIVVVQEGTRIIGIMPLCLRQAQYLRMTPRLLEFIGGGVIGSDYLDAIARRGCEALVAEALGEESRQRARVLHLAQLKKEGSFVETVAPILERSGWKASTSAVNVCPYIALAGHTWESFLATLGSSHRYNFNRRLRNLHREFHVELKCIRSVEDSERALDTVIDLHRKRWGTSEAFQTPDVIAFHREFVRLAAARGWLRVFILSLDGTPAAAIYGLRYESVFYFYQSGFDPLYARNSLGLVTMGLSIQSAIEEGVSEYDLLHGDEEYKFHWARKTRGLSRLEIYPPHYRGDIYRRAIGWNRAARRLARRVLNKP